MGSRDSKFQLEWRLNLKHENNIELSVNCHEPEHYQKQNCECSLNLAIPIADVMTVLHD